MMTMQHKMTTKMMQLTRGRIGGPIRARRDDLLDQMANISQSPGVARRRREQRVVLMHRTPITTITIPTIKIRMMERRTRTVGDYRRFRRDGKMITRPNWGIIIGKNVL